MTQRRAIFRRLAEVILPWPAPHERKAAIETARREKERSRERARQAAGIEAAIARMAEENHFAQAIVSQIMERHARGEV